MHIGVLLLSSFCGLAYNPPAVAAPPIAAKVIFAGTYDDGRLFARLDTTISQSGRPDARFDVVSSSPAIKAWPDIAFTALLAGRTVERFKKRMSWALPDPISIDRPYSYLN